MTKAKNTVSSKKAVVMALAAILAIGVSAPAHADWHGDDHRNWGHRDWDRHAHYVRHDWDYYHGPRPGYVYGPPVYEAPPPPSPGLNLILPLNFR